MYKKWHKTPSKKPTQRSWDEDEMKVIGWCMNKNIKVSISPDWKNDISTWQIDININGKIHTDPKKYEDSIVYNKVNEYYKYYYDKYKK